MGALTDNPVLEREIRGRLRLRFRSPKLGSRLATLLVFLIIAYYYIRSLIGIWHGSAQDARDFWPLLAYGALSLVVLLAPALSASAISREREQQTWDNLVTTRISADEVLLGKWLGRQIIPWILILILLPFMAVCVSRAQLGFMTLPSVLLFLMVTTACYSAFGLLCSFQARRTVTATSAALVATVFFCIGTEILADALTSVTRISPNADSAASLILWLNPFKVLDSLLELFWRSPAVSPIGGSGATVTMVLFYCAASLAGTAAILRYLILRYGHSG